jgi:glycosyltransferase involved in cell wall biosynthesis
MERLAPVLGPRCLKVFHIDTAHLLAHNAAEANRLLNLAERRGITLHPVTHQRVSRGIEFADCATGNAGAFALGTHAYARKPIYPLPAPVAHTYDWMEKDWNRVRTQFLWLGSAGLVHKGLDLVLDAFSTMPEFHLTIFAPLDQELEFKRAYERELYQLPNVQAAGWVRMGSEEFRKATLQCGALVYPSCSEGLSTSTLECMHAGLIPVVSTQTGVPMHDYGLELSTCSVTEIQERVRQIARMSSDELRTRSRRSWEFARANHTRERFSQVYRETMTAILKSRMS